MAKKIRINDGADADEVMRVIARTADELGFALESPTAATAHDGDKKVRGGAAATGARIGIQIEPDEVKLKSETTGAAYAAAGSAFFTTRINWRVSKFSKQTTKALAAAGLS